VIASGISNGVLALENLPTSEMLPLNGEIVGRPNSNGITLRIRETPPTINNLGIYQLGKEICLLQDGTKFQAIQRQNIINGEVWYGVTITEPIPKNNDCNQSPFSAWIIGQFSNGDRILQFEEPQIAPPVLIPPEEDLSSDMSNQAERNGEEVDSFGNHFESRNLVFWSLGALLGFCIVAIEKADNNPDFDIDLSPKMLFKQLQKIRKVDCLRLLTLVIIAFTIRFSIFSIYLSNPAFEDADPTQIALINFISGGILGSFIGGFILAILLLRFISFTE
jgi:hypothetical protein